MAVKAGLEAMKGIGTNGFDRNRQPVVFGAEGGTHHPAGRPKQSRSDVPGSEAIQEKDSICVFSQY